MTLVKGNVRIGVHTRFGPNWPGKRCLAKTRRGTSLSEGRIQAQWALRVTRVVAQLDLRLSGAYSASQRLTLSTVGRQKIS